MTIRIAVAVVQDHWWCRATRLCVLGRRCLERRHERRDADTSGEHHDRKLRLNRDHEGASWLLRLYGVADAECVGYVGRRDAALPPLDANPVGFAVRYNRGTGKGIRSGNGAVTFDIKADRKVLAGAKIRKTTAVHRGQHHGDYAFGALRKMSVTH